MLLESIIPQLPSSNTETAVFVVAVLGVILTIYSQFVEAENRRDMVRMVGSFSVFVYALYIFNIIFIVLSFGIFVASLIEFIEIFMGYHHHTRKDVGIYKHIGKK
ncbi:hypothetical protein KJ641_01550 [Patescibacteria group bacterium]|nr:hypothetical protein [Patescibacteria group bacterium]MBU1895537.1 hypothetical protein [Patescibacteria group bacterium]